MFMKNAGLAVLVVSFFLCTGSAMAQLNNQKPQDMQDVGVEERLGDYIPLDLTFADAAGDSVTIGGLLEEGKPVLLNPVYYECPQLCSMVKEAIFEAVEGLQWSPGKDYTIITFSIDSTEKTELAKKNKKEFITRLNKTGAEEGWHFLTGSQKNIRTLTDAIGFDYKRLENGQFAHGAAITFLSPEGTITRYLYGIQFDQFNFRNALYESADGNIGSTVEQVLLYCYQYDADSNTYVPVAWRIMRLGGFATMIILGIFLGFMWFRYRQSKTNKQIEIKNGRA